MPGGLWDIPNWFAVLILCQIMAVFSTEYNRKRLILQYSVLLSIIGLQSTPPRCRFRSELKLPD